MYDPLRVKAGVAISVAASFLVGLGIASRFDAPHPAYSLPTLQTAPVVADAAVQPALTLSDAFVAVADAVTPAVVRIEASRQRVDRGELPDEILEFFRGPRPDTPQLSGGSGFILSEDGYVLTNNHVIEDAQEITVWLLDGRNFAAEIVGTDPTTDIAVIRIEGGANLPVAALGSSAEVRVGEWILAIGNPGLAGSTSLDYTVTAGIVSAVGRSLNLINRTLEQEDQGRAIEDYIQTDAVINSGNSGGPMVNLRGQVIGINSAIVSRTGVYQGYGFAIPIDLAHRVMDDLIAYGRVRRAYLGVNVETIDAEMAELLELPDVGGAIVRSLTRGAAAEQAGIHLNDVIRDVDGERVRSANDLQHKIALRAPGDRARIGIHREGRAREITVELRELPVAGEVDRAPVRASRAADKIGIVDVVEVTPELAEQLQLSSADGVVVAEVQPNGPAERRGLRRQCVITGINDIRVEDEDDLRDALDAVGAGEVVGVTAACPQGSATRTDLPVWQSRLYAIRVPR